MLDRKNHGSLVLLKGIKKELERKLFFCFTSEVMVMTMMTMAVMMLLLLRYSVFACTRNNYTYCRHHISLNVIMFIQTWICLYIVQESFCFLALKEKKKKRMLSIDNFYFVQFCIVFFFFFFFFCNANPPYLRNVPLPSRKNSGGTPIIAMDCW